MLALSDGGLSTPAVYGELDRQRETGPVGVVSDPADVLAALRKGDAVALGRALRNDLQPAALALKPALRLLLDTGASSARSARSCPAPARPSCSSPATTPTPCTSRRPSPARASARAVRRADGPVAGARVVEVA